MASKDRYYIKAKIYIDQEWKYFKILSIPILEKLAHGQIMETQKPYQGANPYIGGSTLILAVLGTVNIVLISEILIRRKAFFDP